MSVSDTASPASAMKYEILPKVLPSGELDGELLEVAMGPHHPSTHGVFRMDVMLDGETVVRLKPVFGYLHRNHEKIAEHTSYLGSMPYTDRLDYFCSLTNNWAYALAVEKLAGLAVPERAEYIRVITAELTRLQNHASLVGFLMQDMGALGTPLMYAFREREKILDLFESLTGARMMCNYMRFGGCRVDDSVHGEGSAKGRHRISGVSVAIGVWQIVGAGEAAGVAVFDHCHGDRSKVSHHPVRGFDVQDVVE